MYQDHMNELDPTAPISEQASYWWVLLNNGTPTPADHHAFGEWVARSPERVEAFLETARLTRALKSKNVHWPDTPVDILVRDAKAASAEVLPFGRTEEASYPRFAAQVPESRRRALQRPMLFGMAAALLLAIVAGTWAFFASPQRYQTMLGEQRSVVLNDGSVVTLNTSSSIEVRLAKDRRSIRLLSGEALFQVAHDRSRPFDVIAGDTTVRAVGTQFNVDRRAGSTTVTVVEGRVSLSDAQGKSLRDIQNAAILLSAGERVTVAANVRPRPIRANVATATAWTQRRLVFEHRPLGEVAEEFNRYNRQTIEIDSAELRNEEVTGVFQANDPNSFMTFLGKIPGVTIERSADNTRFVITQDTGSEDQH